jgi:hypothetical protein
MYLTSEKNQKSSQNTVKVRKTQVVQKVKLLIYFQNQPPFRSFKKIIKIMLQKNL